MEIPTVFPPHEPGQELGKTPAGQFLRELNSALNSLTFLAGVNPIGTLAGEPETSTIPSEELVSSVISGFITLPSNHPHKSFATVPSFNLTLISISSGNSYSVSPSTGKIAISKYL